MASARNPCRSIFSMAEVFPQVPGCCNQTDRGTCARLRRVASRIVLAAGIVATMLAGCDATPRHGVRLELSWQPAEGADRDPEVPDRVLSIVQDRLARFERATVFRRGGGKLVVEVADPDADVVTDVQHSLDHRGDLRFERTVTRSAFLDCLFVHFDADRPTGIERGVDTLPDGGSDAYLAGPRDELQRYVTRLRDDRTCTMPGDRALAYEQLSSHPDTLAGSTARALGGERWRTHLLDTAAWLTGASIAQATAEPTDHGRWVVRIELDADGGRRFGDRSARHVGEKLAVVLDGTVVSSPVVRGPIRGGRIEVSMGGTGPGEREARRLAAMLGAGSLPGSFVLEHTHAIEIAPRDDRRWFVFGLIGLAGVAFAIYAVSRRR